MHNLWVISNIEDLIKLATGLGIYVSDSLADNIRTVYEWEYKHHRIAQSNIFERRRLNILKLIEEDMQPVYQFVINALINVYFKWVSEHDISDLDNISQARAQDIIKMWEDDGYDAAMSPMLIVESEYNRYIGSGGFEESFIEDNIALFQGLIQQYINPEIEDIKVELESGPNEDLQEQLNYLESYDLSSAEGIQEYIATYFESVRAFMDICSNNGTLTLGTYQQMISNFWSMTISTAWEGEWEGQGLSDTVEQNKSTLAALQHVDTTDFGNTNATINMALNGVHVTGSMLEHIQEQYYDVDKDLLSELSNIDTTKWDEDLKYYGA